MHVVTVHGRCMRRFIDNIIEPKTMIFNCFCRYGWVRYHSILYKINNIQDNIVTSVSVCKPYTQIYVDNVIK